MCPQPTPLNVVQLLASGIFLHVTGNAEPAVAMLSAALSGVWPPGREMQRRLVAAQFMPSVALAEDSVAEGAPAEEPEAANAEPEGEQAAGAGTGPGSFAGAEEAGMQPGGGDPAAAAAAANDAADEADAANPFAAELESALAALCPSVSAADLQKAALVLRLFFGCRAVGEQAAAAQRAGQRPEQLGPPFQAVLRTLLLDCQQLLELDPGCTHAYVWAAQLALYARWPLEAGRVEGLLREGAERAKAAKCERSRMPRWCRRVGGQNAGDGASAASWAGNATFALAELRSDCCRGYACWKVAPQAYPPALPSPRRLAGCGRGAARPRVVASQCGGGGAERGGAPGAAARGGWVLRSSC